MLRCTDDDFSYWILSESGNSLGGSNVGHIPVVAGVVADMPETGVHLGAELGDVAQHTDCPRDPAARVEDVVLVKQERSSQKPRNDKTHLTIVRPQQLHVFRHPDGTDEVDGEEKEECGGAGPDNDDDDSQGLDPQEVEISIPNETLIPVTGIMIISTLLTLLSGRTERNQLQ